MKQWLNRMGWIACASVMLMGQGNATAGPAQRKTQAESLEESKPVAKIVLYGASWCGACQQAKQYFNARGYRFKWIDIDRSPLANAEATRIAQAAGLSGGAIPLIIVNGHVMEGFDPNEIQHYL